jgi:hypothetical protein
VEENYRRSPKQSEPFPYTATLVRISVNTIAPKFQSSMK